MLQWYEQAAEQTNQPVNFIWNDTSGNIKRHGFNLDYKEAIRTKAWPFGRVAATIMDGVIVVCEDGSYFAKGRLVYESDTFSWETDGNDFWHNRGIAFLGSNWNAPGAGNCQGGVFSPGPEYVRWSHHSPSYPDGNMPVHYARDYHFCTHGTKPRQ